MNLAGIEPADIVLVDKNGREFYATVTEKDEGGLRVRPHSRNVTWFTASAREVKGHWRKMGRKRHLKAVA